jgi:hypothetical protein
LILECWFNEAIELRKGDIVRIVRAFKNDNPLHVTELENITTNVNITSRDERVVMSISPVKLAEPIIGKVISSARGGNNTTSCN